MVDLLKKMEAGKGKRTVFDFKQSGNPIQFYYKNYKVGFTLVLETKNTLVLFLSPAFQNKANTPKNLWHKSFKTVGSLIEKAKCRVVVREEKHKPD